MSTITSSAVRTGALLALLAGPALAQSDRIGCIWDRHADSPIARFEAGTIPIDGQLYAFGGFFNQAIQASARVDAYDPVSDTWTQKADMPDNTTHIGFVRENRNVWLIGGFVGDNPGFATSDVWIYDIDGDTWSAGPSMPRPIAAGGVALLNGRIHYFGGCEADRDTTTGDHWVLDLANQAAGWQPLASMPVPRCHLSGAALGGEAWAIGGQFNHDTNPTDTDWVHAYDPVMDSWRQGPSLPENMSHFEPGTFVDSGMLYIAGGKDLTTGREVVATVLELDPVLGEWAYLPPLPAARYGPGAQLLGGRLYAANGAAPGNVPQTDLYSRDWNTSFPNPLYINCGGPEVMSATGSFCWCGDIGYQNGRVANFNPNSNIGGTDEDDVFDQQRESRFSNNDPVRYRLPLGPGIYRVKFHLAERGTSAPGNRVLDLEVEGEVLAAGVDLAADPGFQIAFEQGFDVRVLDDNVDIAIRTPPGQRALVGALEVEKLPDDHFEFECMNAANSTGAMAEMDFLGTSSIAANDFTLLTTSVPFSQFGLFVQGENPGSFGLPAGGTLCIGGPFFRLPIVQAVGNTMSYELDLQTFFQPGTEIVAGSTWRFQGWFRDPAGPTPSNLSNALKISFTP